MTPNSILILLNSFWCNNICSHLQKKDIFKQNLIQNCLLRWLLGWLYKISNSLFEKAIQHLCLFRTIRPHLSWKKMELGKSIEKQNNDIVVRLAKQVIDTVANGSNLVFSPTSINVLLSLIAAGSSSVTKEQILSSIMSPSTDHLKTVLAKIVDGTERSDRCLSMANGVWIDKSVSLKHSFKDLLENSYKATCSQVEFAAKVTFS